MDESNGLLPEDKLTIMCRVGGLSWLGSPSQLPSVKAVHYSTVSIQYIAVLLAYNTLQYC